MVLEFITRGDFMPIRKLLFVCKDVPPVKAFASTVKIDPFEYELEMYDKDDILRKWDDIMEENNVPLECRDYIDVYDAITNEHLAHWDNTNWGN